MNSQKKLVLIWKCIIYANKYKSQNKIDFLDIIHKFLKDLTKYDFQKPKVIIIQWVKTYINKLVDEEIDFKVQIK